MIVWGGYGGSYFNSGGRYNPGTDTWIATTTANAPTARVAHVAVWTGAEMIVWGGTGYANTGAKYNPTSDSWTSMSTPPIAARVGHSAVWDGTEMIVWGGSAVPDGYTNTGARYNPKTDSWTLTSTMHAPDGRAYHTAIWTGSEMIIWGGSISTGALQTGGRYNPITDSWLPTNVTNAPAARDSHTAVWVGNEMIVWGGYGTSSLNTGGRYNASSDTWIATSTFNVPTARKAHTAVWTGNQMIVWGGYYTDNGNVALNTGGRYCAQPQTPFAESAVSRKNHGAAGTFDVDLPFIGTPGIESRRGSATNDHVMVITFSVNVTVNGNPQAAVTSGLGTVGSNGMSNGGMVSVNGNLVMVPLTNVANAQTINVTLYAINGDGNVVIPMNLLAGDVNNNGSANASDVAFTKTQIGRLINQANFRADVNASGAINASDVSIVKSHVGTALP